MACPPAPNSTLFAKSQKQEDITFEEFIKILFEKSLEFNSKIELPCARIELKLKVPMTEERIPASYSFIGSLAFFTCKLPRLVKLFLERNCSDRISLKCDPNLDRLIENTSVPKKVSYRELLTQLDAFIEPIISQTEKCNAILMNLTEITGGLLSGRVVDLVGYDDIGLVTKGYELFYHLELKTNGEKMAGLLRSVDHHKAGIFDIHFQGDYHDQNTNTHIFQMLAPTTGNLTALEQFITLVVAEFTANLADKPQTP